LKALIALSKLTTIFLATLEALITSDTTALVSLKLSLASCSLTCIFSNTLSYDTDDAAEAAEAAEAADCCDGEENKLFLHGSLVRTCLGMRFSSSSLPSLVSGDELD